MFGLRPLFGFSRGEMRGVLWLLPLLAVIAVVIVAANRPRFEKSFLEQVGEDVRREEAGRGYSEQEDGGGMDDSVAGDAGLFEFDPNTVTLQELCRLGFSARTAAGIIKYRERGKRFEIPEDFASCYGVGVEQYTRLEPYINIGAEYRVRRSAGYGRENPNGNSGGSGYDGGDRRGGSGYDGGDRRDGSGRKDISMDGGSGPKGINVDGGQGRVVRGRPHGALPGDGGQGTALPGDGGQQTALSVFDPNRLDADGFTALGFSPAQSAAIIRYRTAAGGFRTAEDFGRSYVVSTQMFEKLSPYITIGESGTPESGPKRLVELNGADSVQLRSVSGIGGTLVVRILDYRERLGGYVRVEQLAEIPGMTQENYNRIKQQIFVDSCVIQKIDINFASHQNVVDALGNHPYITTQGLRKLLKNRQLKGGWRSIEDMAEQNIVTTRQAERLAPYLIFRTE